MCLLNCQMLSRVGRQDLKYIQVWPSWEWTGFGDTLQTLQNWAGSLLLSLCSHNQSLGVDPSGWMFTWFVQICSQPHQICEQPSQVWTALLFVDIWMWSWWFLTGNHWSKVPEWTISVVMLELTIDQVIKAKEWFVSWPQKTKVSDCHCLWLPLTPLNSHLSPQTFTLRGWWVTSCLCQSFQPTFMLSWCLHASYLAHFYTRAAGDKYDKYSHKQDARWWLWELGKPHARLERTLKNTK